MRRRNTEASAVRARYNLVNERGSGVARDGGAAALLRRNRDFRRLTLARIVSFVGDALSLVALMLHVASTTGEALAVAALLLVGDVAPALVSPLTGAVADRFDRRRVMVACELGQAGLLAVLALTLPPLPVLLALVGVRAVLAQVFAPASRAAVPALVGRGDLATANATLGFGTNGAEALGPLVAAALLPFLDTSGVLLVDAASFLLSAALLAGLPALPPGDPGPGGPPPATVLRDALAGLRYLWSVRRVRIVTLGFAAVVAANGIDDVALLVLARDTLGAPDSAVAVLLAAVGIGLLAGYLLVARYAVRVSTAVLLVLGFAVSSLGNLLTGFAWAVAAAFVVQAVRGVGIAAMDVAANTLVQHEVPAAMLGRVFGNLYGAIGLAAAVSYVGGGLLLDATSAPVTFVLAGAAGTLATAAVAVAMRKVRPVR